MACGIGANMLYMANRHENIQFTGMDIEPNYIEYANQMLGKNSKYGNCKFYIGDWFDIESKWIDTFDGIISFQTLSWLSEYEIPLKALAKLNPRWKAVSSLFYEGDIDYSIKLKNYYRAVRYKNTSIGDVIDEEKICIKQIKFLR